MSKCQRYVYNDLGEALRHPRTRQQNPSSLHPGDVVAFHKEYANIRYWHFAIVKKVFSNALDVYEFDQIDSSAHKKLSGPKGVVIENTYWFASSPDFWYVDVPSDFSVEEVLRRARSQVGATNYNLIFYNCEHYVLWCKTGNAYSSQARSAGRVVVEQVARASIKGIATRTLQKEVAKEVVEEGIKTFIKPATKCVTASMVAADVAIGVGSAAWDIAKAEKKLNNGEITKAEYKSAVGTRVAVEIFNTSGAVAGTLVGAGLGGPVGAILGGVVGGLYGKLFGRIAVGETRHRQ